MTYIEVPLDAGVELERVRSRLNKLINKLMYYIFVGIIILAAKFIEKER